ncbi:hypothetical protein E2C05_31380 [Paracraurococcus ruber]|uniref:carbohydrate-binding domain-containing protein n=1 Tax=Paracraurococcus ruber TaxID=77675 RepID=UPI0010577E65|nr:carbohydrate-binding domain-containing protein [Paracraurococcus ruber]TDG08363.1 hypothetical protein E2C05_31380 [Paracraurococcus ruber]
MTTDVNVLVRGQSNAEAFIWRGGAARLEADLEAANPGIDVHIVANYQNVAFGFDYPGTIYSGTGFLNWDTDGEQRNMLTYLVSLPAELRDNPTVTLWMHNEFDGNTAGVTTAQWVGEVRTDAALVRGVLGQDAATTPYLFTYVPYPYTQPGSPEAIRAGMDLLVADPAFQAGIAPAAMTGLAMDGDGAPGGQHMGQADVMLVADRLAAVLGPGVAALSHLGGTGSQTIGAGAASLVLKISQDAWLGSAQYTVVVDGVQVGGTLTAAASHAAGQSDTVAVLGPWGPGLHVVTVTFVNDAWDGTPQGDRNLHVDGISLSGGTVPVGTASLLSAGPVSFAVIGAAAAPVNQVIGAGSSSLVLKISQDAWIGSAQYMLAVDGVPVGGTLTASALHGSGQDDTITLKGDWAAGPHRLTVTFLNDAWDGTPQGDRNLHVDGIAHDGVAVAGGTASLLSAGPADFLFV